MPYEFLDHTADVQIHAWGSDLKQAFEQVCIGMFAYMTDIATVDVDESLTRTIEISEHDLESALYALMNEALFQFAADYFIVREVEIVEFDTESFRIRAILRGEQWDMGKHPQGTEVKAITYSNMQIFDTPDRHEVYVIIDI